MKMLHQVAQNPNAVRNATDLEKKVFYYTYDKAMSFGLRFGSVDVSRLGEPSEEMFALLDKLRTRQWTGQFARSETELFAEKHGNLIKLICNKHLQSGFTATTLNKALPGLVPVFKVQLAKEVPMTKLRFPLLGQLKYDGIRVVILTSIEGVKFFTRNGLELILPKTAALLKPLLPLDIMLDTEVTIKDGASIDRTKVSGMMNSARHGNSINESLIQFNVFDYMKADVFNVQGLTQPYALRLSDLEFVLSAYVSHTTNVLKLAETKLLLTPDEANKWFNTVVAEGQEGLILKPCNHEYKFRRTADWAKLKVTDTADLRCIGTEEGLNKYEGMIGALVCEGTVKGEFVSVRVGSGLTDEDRAADESDYVGRTIEVKYNSVIANADGTCSLFLPRYVGVRYDK